MPIGMFSLKRATGSGKRETRRTPPPLSLPPCFRTALNLLRNSLEERKLHYVDMHRPNDRLFLIQRQLAESFQFAFIIETDLFLILFTIRNYYKYKTFRPFTDLQFSESTYLKRL